MFALECLCQQYFTDHRSHPQVKRGIVKNSGTINVNAAGDFVLDFKQNSTTAGQCAIDNITWTANSTILPEPRNYPTNFVATPGYL